MTHHIVYCWELGMGLGHVTRMDRVANDPAVQSCRFSFILREVSKGKHIDKCTTDNLYQAPVVFAQSKGSSPNFSHLLMRCGWNSAESAIAITAAWRNLFLHLKPDVVLLDHAPSAGLAALSLGIPIKGIGNGFEQPPVDYPMPTMQLHLPADLKQLQEIDDKLNQVFDQVEMRFMGSSNQRLRLTRLYDPKHCLIAGLTVLDHYGARTEPWRYLSAITNPQHSLQDLSVLENTDKPKLFFYLYAHTPELVAILTRLSESFTVFGRLASEPSSDQMEALQQTGVLVCEQILNIDQALDTADFAICNSQFGSLQNTIVNAIPTIAIPLQLEQNMLAYQLYKQGLVWAVAPQNALQQIDNHLQAWIDKSDQLVQRLTERVVNQPQQNNFWQGNLLEDFLLKT